MTIEVGTIIAICGLILSYLVYQLNKSKETKTDTQQDARIQAQLEYIGKGVDDIRIDLKSNEKQMVEQGKHIVKLEESIKSAHKRIDFLEKDGN